MKRSSRILTGLWSNITHAGLSREIYQSVKPLVLAENTRIMQSLGAIGLIFGSVMTVLSLLGKVSRHVLPAYLTLLIVSALFFVLQHFYESHGKTAGIWLSYLQMGAVLTYGIMNSSFFAPGTTTMGVTVIVLMTLVPFLLIDVPWREFLLIIGTAIVYLIGVYLRKDPSIWGIETTNTISFCLVACMSSTVFTTRTIRSMADRLYIEKERDTDTLTGLSSRHAGELLIRSLLLRRVSGIFIIMDVDNFKSVNDRFGHPYGDRVLAAVGAAVSASIRRKDMAARYGGDEMVIFLVDCRMDDAYQVIGRIQRFLSDSFASEPIQITCSFGLAQARPEEDLKDLLKRADEALYQAKRGGKNRYVKAL